MLPRKAEIEELETGNFFSRLSPFLLPFSPGETPELIANLLADQGSNPLLFAPMASNRKPAKRASPRLKAAKAKAPRTPAPVRLAPAPAEVSQAVDVPARLPEKQKAA